MPSFDIVSEVNLMEVDNAVSQACKEIATRFDFKGSKCEIKWDRTKLDLTGDDEFRLKALREVLEGKLAKRGVSLKSLDYGNVEVSPMGHARQEVKLRQGIEQPKAKEIIGYIKELKIKVQPQIHEDKVRVNGRSRDDLQSVIAAVQGKDFSLPLSFGNYRD
jgi:cyclic-di-GMP-binding protein